MVDGNTSEFGEMVASAEAEALERSNHSSTRWDIGTAVLAGWEVLKDLLVGSAQDNRDS